MIAKTIVFSLILLTFRNIHNVKLSFANAYRYLDDKEKDCMRYVLENDTLRVEIDSFGAELKSVKRKSDGKEYMWYADKKYWGRRLYPL